MWPRAGEQFHGGLHRLMEGFILPVYAAEDFWAPEVLGGFGVGKKRLGRAEVEIVPVVGKSI